MYRPAWTGAIAEQIDEIRACLKGREAPTEVIHVTSLARARATGVTSVDGTGSVENCSSKGLEVIWRRPAPARPEDFVGLPRFVLADEQGPAHPPGRLLEEVVRDGEVLGWLYWPESESQGGDDANEE